MEFTKNLEQLFDTNKTIDTVEKGVLSVLAYVQPTEVSKTLSNLVMANSDFVRANLEALKSVQGYVTKAVEEAQNSFTKAVK